MPESPESPATVGSLLEEDHHRIDAQFRAFADSLASGPVDTAAFTAGSTALRHHIWVEEELHFPPLREAGLVGPILVMLSEHGRIWDLLDALEAGLQDGRPGAELGETWRQLEQVLTDHNLKEERIVYPNGDQVLPAETAEEVLTALASGEAPPGWVCEMAGRS